MNRLLAALIVMCIVAVPIVCAADSTVFGGGGSGSRSACGTQTPVNAGSAVTGTNTINWSQGYNQYMTLTGSTTTTMVNPVSGCCYNLKVTQGGSGSYTVTFSPVPKAQGGTLPVLSTTAGKYDLLILCYDGTNYTIEAGNDYR